MSEQFQCDYCGELVPEANATTETVASGPHGETDTIAFCPECSK